MARVELTVQDVVRTGLSESLSQATESDGYAFDNQSHKAFLHVKNDSGSSVDVTIQTPGTIDGLAIPERIVAVGNGAEKIVGPFPHGLHCKKDNTLGINHAVWVDYSAQSTQLLQAAVKLPDPTY